MLTSRGGFLDYSRFPRDLGKSTVFAAYAAYSDYEIGRVVQHFQDLDQTLYLETQSQWKFHH